MPEMKLSSPWITYVHEIQKMFERDSEVRVMYDDENKEVKLFVDSIQKAEALEKILRHERTFGNVVLKITVVPSNKEKDILDVFNDAFFGNTALLYTVPLKSPLGIHRFVVFDGKVVQFYNDQLDDPNGNKSTLYQEIAKDIFDDKFAVNFCTEVVDKNASNKPLGEWP